MTAAAAVGLVSDVTVTSLRNADILAGSGAVSWARVEGWEGKEGLGLTTPTLTNHSWASTIHCQPWVPGSGTGAERGAAALVWSADLLAFDAAGPLIQYCRIYTVTHI